MSMCTRRLCQPARAQCSADRAQQIFWSRFDLAPFVAARSGDLCHLEHYTPYLPPELQEAAGSDGDPSHPLAGTMYNLGAIGYHLLTGQPPMGEGNVETLLERHRTLRPARAAEVGFNSEESVRFGGPTTDEMALGWLSYSYDDEQEAALVAAEAAAPQGDLEDRN